MKTYYLEQTQRLPIAPDVAWAFFSNPANLAQLMPPWIRMEPPMDGHQSGNPARKIFPGYVFNFKAKMFGWIPVPWLGEITQMESGRYFVDVMHSGPFSFWHHTHWLEPVLNASEPSVDIIDRLYYAMPAGPLGELAHSIAGRKMLQSMFDYRRKMLTEFFGEGGIE